MDETEVQVEIVCWAQEHPNAERINWQGANEPWVSFPGKLCTLHIGLGGMIWSIGVPVGYQTQLSPIDGSRQRCWEPFDFHDGVIIPDRNTPFRVSVLYSKKDRNAVEETRLLVQEPGYDVQEAQENVMDLLKHLQISGDTSSDNTSKQGQRWLIKSMAYFQTMNEAQTLSEVLDAIHALTTFYAWDGSSSSSDLDELQRMYSMDSNSTNGESPEDDLFVPEPAFKWSWIISQVEYAADACRMAKNHVHGGVTDPNSSCSGPLVVKMVEEMDRLQVADIITVTSASPMLLDFDSESLQMTDDYTYVRDANSRPSGNFSPETFNRSSRISRSSSDSELSVDTDDDWEHVQNLPADVSADVLRESEDTGNEGQFKNKRKFQPAYAAAAGSAGGAGAALKADILPASTTTTCYEKTPEVQLGSQERRIDVLQYCEISFNAASFSVECTIRLDQFMVNNTDALTAMGLSLEHPLRIEVVPNKEQVDGLAWTGLIEVYVSQQSEWHSHVSEEVCGLLCFIPHIVRHYFERNVLAQLNHWPTMEPKGEIFIGLLESVVTRLVCVSRDFCCVCLGPLDKVSRTFVSRIMWPCDDNMCQALFTSWQAVSSYDADERARQEQESLAEVERNLREDYPYSEYILDNLRCELQVYNVDCTGLHYGQMIRALARIELWNRRDLEQVS